MRHSREANISGGILSFLLLALLTPALFSAAAALPFISNSVQFAEALSYSFAVALLGIWVFPSWLLVALVGAVVLAVCAPRELVGSLAFICATSVAAVVWSLATPHFPAHKTVHIAAAAALAALAALHLNKWLQIRGAT